MVSIGLDLWNTLIKGNPKFKKVKYDLLQSYFPLLNVDKAFIAMKRAKVDFDTMVNSTGLMLSDEQMLRHTFHFIFPTLTFQSLEYKMFKEWYAEYLILSVEHSPTLYDDDTYNVLKEHSKHFNLCLSSNTRFMGGKTLTKVLDKLDILPFFDRLLFSDELKVSKPNVAMFKGNKYHVGDNYYTDFLYPQEHGVSTVWIHNDPVVTTLREAMNIIAKKEIINW